VNKSRTFVDVNPEEVAPTTGVIKNALLSKFHQAVGQICFPSTFLGKICKEEK